MVFSYWARWQLLSNCSLNVANVDDFPVLIPPPFFRTSCDTANILRTFDKLIALQVPMP